MSKAHQAFIQSEFEDIVSFVSGSPIAIGSVKLEETLWEKIKNRLVFALFGAIARSIVSNFSKPKHEYLILTEDKLTYLELIGGEKRTLTEYKLSELKDVSVASDEMLVTISFKVQDEAKTYQIWQYNVYSPDGTYFTDTETLKTIGEMTKLFSSLVS